MSSQRTTQSIGPLLCAVAYLARAPRFALPLALAFGSSLTLSLVSAASADSADAARDILDQSVSVGKEIQIAIKDSWTLILTGPLFVDICTLGAIVMALLVGAWAILWLNGNFNPNDSKAVALSAEQLFCAIFLAILLGTPVERGKLLGTFALASHEVFNGVTDQLVANLQSNIQGDIIAQASIKNSLESAVPQDIQACAAIDDVKKRDFCLQRTDDRYKSILSTYPNQGWAAQLYERIHSTINAALSKDSQNAWDPLGDIASGASSYVGALGQGAATLVIRGALLSFGTAFIVALEHSLLLTAMVCPIFIGWAFSSLAFEPFLAWILGYIGVGSALGMYKIILGVVSLTILKSPPNDPLLYPMVIAVFGVPLTLILVGGGGLAIFGGISRSISGLKK